MAHFFFFFFHFLFEPFFFFLNLARVAHVQTLSLPMSAHVQKLLPPFNYFIKKIIKLSNYTLNPTSQQPKATPQPLNPFLNINLTFILQKPLHFKLQLFHGGFRFPELIKQNPRLPSNLTYLICHSLLQSCD